MRHRLRLSLVLLLVLVSAAFVASAGDSASSSSASAAVASPASSALSGCQLCASSGDCSHAYLDGPGQFCGNWLDQLSQRQRCCCPRDATCKVSNYACKCSRANEQQGPSSGDNGDVTVWAAMSVLFAAATIGCCVACWCMQSGCCCCRRQEYVHSGRPDVVYATPVYAPAVHYGASAPYGYSDGFDGGTGALLGGTAGLLGGLLIGEAIADAGDGPRFDGGFDGGAGGDTDFGGDF
ncbi:hypothetical protein ATCC90586_004948 [Pythium insidiosum]|nr:hypothetical protein ATCC90586_004948 [Pythium insidiosum]